MIVGIEKPTSGKVFISDIDITRLPINERADLGISYLAQEASIFRKLTVEDNLRAILQTRNLSKKEQDKKIDGTLSYFFMDPNPFWDLAKHITTNWKI
jgi:lipopolysaccharide export system ATP-binding protein